MWITKTKPLPGDLIWVSRCQVVTFETYDGIRDMDAWQPAVVPAPYRPPLDVSSILSLCTVPRTASEIRKLLKSDYKDTHQRLQRYVRAGTLKKDAQCRYTLIATAS